MNRHPAVRSLRCARVVQDTLVRHGCDTASRGIRIRQVQRIQGGTSASTMKVYDRTYKRPMAVTRSAILHNPV